MRATRSQKIIASFLLAGQLLFWPLSSFAFVLTEGTPDGSLMPVPSSDSGALISNNAFNLALVPIQAANTSCDTAIKAFEATDHAAQLAMGFGSVISGGGAYAAALGSEIAAYETYITCEQAVLDSLNVVIAPNSYTSTVKQQNIDQVSKKILTYEAKDKSAQQKYEVASENVWKALLITVLINTTKTVANQLVNKLVNNYKIKDIKQYADSLATLAYDNQFIRDNFPDAQGQLMARAILTNPTLRNSIQSGIYAQAQQNLGFDPLTINYNDPNFYGKLAMVGNAQSSPQYLQSIYTAQTDLAHANALQHAQAQISQGQGYKAPVNCAGSLSQQKSIDLQAKALTDQLNNRKALLDNLNQAKTAGQNVSSTDLAKAQLDYNKALTAWNDAPDAMGTSSPAIIMCEAISSPAVLVNQGIDAVFKQMSSNMSNYNSSNLPGFLSQMSSIATQIGSSLILGAMSGQKATINEQAAIGAAVSAASAATVQTFNNNAIENLAKGIDFEAAVNTSVTNGYQLSWTVDDTVVKTASYVTLTGNGISGTVKMNSLSGAYSLTTTTGGNYLLNVYNSSGKALTSATLTITPTQTAYNYTSSGPAVAGAFTSRQPLAVRGVVEQLHPRGE